MTGLVQQTNRHKVNYVPLLDAHSHRCLSYLQIISRITDELQDETR